MLLLLLMLLGSGSRRKWLLLLMVMVMGTHSSSHSSSESGSVASVQTRSVVGNRIVLEWMSVTRGVPRLEQVLLLLSGSASRSSRGQDPVRRSPRPDVLAPRRRGRHLERTAPVALHPFATGVQRRAPLALGVVAPSGVAGGSGGVVVGGKAVAGAEGVAVDDRLPSVMVA